MTLTVAAFARSAIDRWRRRRRESRSAARARRLGWSRRRSAAAALSQATFPAHRRRESAVASRSRKIRIDRDAIGGSRAIARSGAGSARVSCGAYWRAVWQAGRGQGTSAGVRGAEAVQELELRIGSTPTHVDVPCARDHGLAIPVEDTARRK